MTAFTPDWKVTINSVEYTDVTLANLVITSGRQDINRQPVAGYCQIEIINLDLSAVTTQINQGITISLKDSTATYQPIFGGFISDIVQEVRNLGNTGQAQVITITALGALSRLPKATTEGVLAEDFDGDQIYSLLEPVLFQDWAQTPAALTWAGVSASEDWVDYANTGLGEIDQPGDYEMISRSASTTDVYTLAADIAQSGLGYLYEDAQGRIGYADSTNRSEYLSVNGYVELSAADANGRGIRLYTKGGDIRNYVTIFSGNNFSDESTDQDDASIAIYGNLSQSFNTFLKHKADAEAQAARILELRAYPRAQLDAITFPLQIPKLSDADRDALINVFIGMPVDLQDLPANMSDAQFQGFVEGWTFRAGYNTLDLTILLSPVAFSLTAFRWNSVPAVETWNTISGTLDWLNATIVA
jgi:hypothetical protein